MSVADQPLRLFALGRFPGELPTLAPSLVGFALTQERCAGVDSLPNALGSQDVLVADLAWLEGLPDDARRELGRRAAGAAAWIAFTEPGARFKDQVSWLRTGVSHFFSRAPDTERLVALIEDIHDRRNGPPLRVILLDDEESALDYYSAVLEEAGVVVQATQDPLLVLEVIEEFRPDLLLVDIEMPGCRGPELVTIVRQRAAYADLPVIFLTAMESLQDKLLARQAAAEDFLAKPVAPELLVTAVRSQAWRHRALQRAERTLRRREARGRYRLEQLRMAIDEHAIVSIADVNGNIVYANDRFCSISGFSRQELLGQNHRIVKSGLHPPEFFQDLWRTISGGRVWQGEISNRARDGSIYWVEATIVPFLDSRGKPTQYISIRTDVTEIKRIQEELRVSEERLRRGQAFANIGTWDWNVQTGELYWSERIAPLFGHAVGTLATSYDNFLAALHPDDRQAVVDAVAACVERDVPYEIEHRVVWPDGTVRWLLERGAVVRDPAGRALQMLGVVQDVHERKQAELALVDSERRLRESEERFAFAVVGAGDGIWDWNMRTGEMPLSGHYEAMLGYAEGELEPSVDAWVKSVHPDDLARVQQNLQDYLSGKLAVYAIELRLRCKDGGYKWVLCRGTVVGRDAEGKPVRMIGIHSDISERKAGEERLALFRRIFDASGQCFGITDGQGRLLYQNQAHRQELGYPDEDILGQPFTRFLPDDVADRIAAEVHRAATDGGSWIRQLPLRRKDGSVFTSASNVGFVKGADGEVQYIFNIFSDITEELARRDELAQAKEAAERANQAKSDFLSSMSHELRTPMNAIIGFAQMLEYDSGLNTDQQDNVHEILKAGRHLLELINEVLDLAKIESGRIDLSLEPVDLATVVQDCRHLIQPLAAARGIALEMTVPSGIAVRADRVRLKQVLLNLLSNAVKYNRDAGGVILTAATHGKETLRLTVADTGPGIAPARMAELFQPFNRLDAEHSDIEGTGIGLTITRRLVELMGGAVSAESEVGIGSRFHVDLPVGSPAALADTAGAAMPGADVGATRDRCVLCIDDNPVNLKLIAQMLGMRPGVRLITAHLPELGIELALAHRPDLILLDINMPGMDGYQVLKILQAEPRLKPIPVVAVTANAMPRDIERGRAAGFVEYLTKPIDLGLFLATIDRCLEPGAEESP